MSWTRAALVGLVPLLALLLGGCPNEVASDDDSEPEEFDPIDEVGQDDDTSDDDDDDDDLADDDSADPQNELIGLTVQPGDYVIDSTTSYSLLAVAVWEDGSTARVVPDTFTVDPPEVVSVDTAGLVAPLLEGEATITAAYGAVIAAPVTVTVIAPGTMNVLVLDSETGEPQENAELYIGGSEEPLAFTTTDAKGMAVLEGEFSGPVTVTCKKGGHYRTSIYQVTTRDLRFPLNPKGDTEGGAAAGNAIWATEPGALDVQLGFAATSIHGNPVLFDFASIMGEERTLEVMGYEMEMAGNLVLGDVAPDFVAPGDPGAASVFTLTGTFAMEDVLDALEAAEEGSEVSTLLAMLADHMALVSFGMESGLTLEEGITTEVGDIEPFTLVSEQVPVIVPAHPIGFSGDDTPAVFPLAEIPGDGMVVIGLGMGTGGIIVHEAVRTGPLDGVEARYIAVVENDGIGNGNSRSAVISDRVAEGGAIMFPEFLDLTIQDVPIENDNTWTYTGDPETDLFLVTLEGAASPWQVWTRGDTAGFELPVIDPRPGFSHTTWEVMAMGLADTSFETLQHTSGDGLDDAMELIDRQSNAHQQYHIDVEPEEEP